MTIEQMGRLGEPYFSTKEKGAKFTIHFPIEKEIEDSIKKIPANHE